MKYLLLILLAACQTLIAQKQACQERCIEKLSWDTASNCIRAYSSDSTFLCPADYFTVLSVSQYLCPCEHIPVTVQAFPSGKIYVFPLLLRWNSETNNRYQNGDEKSAVKKKYLQKGTKLISDGPILKSQDYTFHIYEGESSHKPVQ